MNFQELPPPAQVRLRSVYPFAIGFYQEVIDAYVNAAQCPWEMSANEVYIAARRELRNLWAQETDPIQREKYRRSLALVTDFKCSGRTYAARVLRIVAEQQKEISHS